MADSISLDWASFTFLVRSERDFIRIFKQIEVLCGDTLEFQDRGFQGYSSSAFILGSGRVGYDFNRLEMGVHLSLPAQALARLMVNDAFPSDGFEFLQDVVWMGKRLYEDITQGVHFTRVDFAFDDRSKVLDYKTIDQAIKDENLVSRCKYDNIKHIGGYSPGSGFTIKFGSMESATWAKIYDKAVEQKVPEHWIRFEITTKKERADELIDRLLVSNDPARLLSEYAYGFLDFKEQGLNHIKSKWDTSAWWAAFLATSDKMRLSLPGLKKTLKEVVGWVARQVSPSLALLHSAYGVDIFPMMVADGLERLSKDHNAMLADFEQKKAAAELLELAKSLGGQSSGLHRAMDLAWADWNERKRYFQRIPKYRGASSLELQEASEVRQQVIEKNIPLRSLAQKILTLNFGSTQYYKQSGYSYGGS